MPVFTRGYRTYEGAFTSRPPFLPILREGVRAAVRMRGFRFIVLLFGATFVIGALSLYLSIGLGEEMRRFLTFGTLRRSTETLSTEELSWRALRGVLHFFYRFVMLLTAVLAVRIGSGLVSEDLRCRALPLYLVRPIRRADYVIGKALVLPAVFLIVAFLPGVLYLSLVSLWQDPGKSWAFFTEHLFVVGLSAQSFLVGAACYTGIMLLFSSFTSRRNVATVLSSIAIFGGFLVHQAAVHRTGGGAILAFMRLLGVPQHTIAGFIRLDPPPWRQAAIARLPSPETIAVLAFVLLAAGCIATYRRVRSVEVSG